MRRATINVFSLSFLDLFSCALAGVIILMLVFVTMLEGRRADRRVFILTAELELTMGASADNPNHGSAAGDPEHYTFASLLKKKGINPRRHIQPLLIDPLGREIELPQTFPEKTNTTLLHYTARRPPQGRWQLILRPSERLRQDFARQTEQQKDPQLPRAVMRIQDLSDRYVDPPSSAQQPGWPDALREIARELQPGGGPAEFTKTQVLQRILLRIRSLADVPPGDHLQKCLELLTVPRTEWRDVRRNSGGIYDARSLGIGDCTDGLEAILATSIFAEVSNQITRRAHRNEVLDWALYNMAYHIWKLRTRLRSDAPLDDVQGFVAEAALAHHLGLADNNRAEESVVWRLLALLAGEKLQAKQRFVAATIHYEPQEPVDPSIQLTAANTRYERISDDNVTRFPSRVPPEAGLFRLVRLARDREVDLRRIGPVDSPVSMVIATRPHEQRARMIAWIEQHRSVSSSVFDEKSYVPLMFYFSHLRTPQGRHDLDGRVQDEMKKLKNASDDNGTNPLDDAGTYFPLLYLTTYREAVRQQKLAIDVRHIMVHWGSRLETVKASRITNRTLLDTEPIILVELYPDELTIESQ